METKICSRCGSELEISEFPIRYIKDDNTIVYRGICKECRNATSRKCYDKHRVIYRTQNRERARREKDIRSIRAKKYRAENRDMLNERGRIYRINNRDKIKEYDKRYRANLSPEKKKEIQIKNSERNRIKLQNEDYRKHINKLHMMCYYAKHEENKAKRRNEYANNVNGIRDYIIEYGKLHRKEANAKRKIRIHNDMDKYRAVRTIYRNKNRDKINKQHRIRSVKERNKLSDTYIVMTLAKRSNLTCTDFRKYPQLIEIKRAQIKILRLTKNQNYETCKCN